MDAKAVTISSHAGRKVKDTLNDRILYGAIHVLMAILVVITLYLLVFVLSASFSSPQAVSTGRVVLLEALKGMTLEEVWEAIFLKGYESRFEGRLSCLHDDGRKLIGRAVTCSYVPTRPDLYQVMMNQGLSEGRKGMFNQWVVDGLCPGDVVAADMYDKIYKGTFLGCNLTTAIKTRTKTGGAVIWGGVRDVKQMKKTDTQVYFRGIDPTPIREFCISSLNMLTRIGNAIVLPGDVVFGAGGGVLFILPQLAEEFVDGAAKTHGKDDFGFLMIQAGGWTTAQIDKALSLEMLERLNRWIKCDERRAEYRALDWTKEMEIAAQGNTDPSKTMVYKERFI